MPNKAEKTNPSLGVFKVLVGEWAIEGTHPYMPGETVNGTTTFEWINGGAFLRSHQKINDARFPEGISIIGSDDVTKEFFMLYFDERDISRKYNITFENNVIRQWRDSAEFSQRMTLTISSDGKSIESKGEMSKNGGTWEGDLALTYTRV